jgi:hypothetical protein
MPSKTEGDNSHGRGRKTITNSRSQERIKLKRVNAIMYPHPAQQ